MERPIVDFDRDPEGDWVARLACGHNQHVRHNPPWIERPWVVTAEGRARMRGQVLRCVKCDRGEPQDPWPPGIPQ